MEEVVSMESKYLDDMIEVLRSSQEALKILEDNCNALKSKIIAEMDKAKINKYSCSVVKNSNHEDSKDTDFLGLEVKIIERTSIAYDLNFLKLIVPEAIEKTLTVDKNNMEDFKSLLKSFGLKGKQVNELVKVMRLKNTVNPDAISKKIDKGEISSDDVNKIADINVTSRYLKICKKP